MSAQENMNQFGPQIKYKIAEVAGLGKALIADQDIPKGTLVHVQKIGVNIDLIGDEKDLLEKLKEFPDKKSKKEFLEGTLAHDGKILKPTNDWHYINHSDDPNIHNGENWDEDFALRDIKKGEIIAEDYYKRYDHPEWLMKLIAQYDVDPRYY